MNDDEQRDALARIERVANAALGEALVTGLLIGPLIETQMRSGSLDGNATLELAEKSLRILEDNDGAGLNAGASVFAHARARLQVMLSRETPAFAKDERHTPYVPAAAPISGAVGRLMIAIRGTDDLGSLQLPR